MGICLHTNFNLIYLSKTFTICLQRVRPKRVHQQRVRIKQHGRLFTYQFPSNIPFKDFHHLSTESTTQKGSSTKSMNIATWAPIHTNVHFLKKPSHKTFNIRLQRVRPKGFIN